MPTNLNAYHTSALLLITLFSSKNIKKHFKEVLKCITPKLRVPFRKQYFLSLFKLAVSFLRETEMQVRVGSSCLLTYGPKNRYWNV